MDLKSFIFFIAVVFCIGVTKAQFIEVIDETGLISSEGYPISYPNDQNVTWHFAAPQGYVVQIQFINFHLESSFDDIPCAYDYLEIKSGSEKKRFCGKPGDPYIPWHHHYLTQTNEATINFVSDYSNDEEGLHGFRLMYWIVDQDECELMKTGRFQPELNWDEVLLCNHHCVNTPGSYRCLCLPQFTLHQDQHTCMLERETKELSQKNGTISSWGYPSLYTKYSDQKWIINVDENEAVVLAFKESFEIEDHPEENDTCPYDRLVITYGGVESEYCGTEAPFGGIPLNTRANRVEIRFVTDRTVEMTGFGLKYSTIKKCTGGAMRIDNGVTSWRQSSAYYPADEITFFCNPGYVLEGDERLTCTDDGTWNTQAPTCTVLDCNEPVYFTSKPHTNVNFNDTVYLSNLTITCEPNYEFADFANAKDFKCGENGRWVDWQTGAEPEDRQIKCRPLCGYRKKVPQTHISQGSDTRTYPWFVSLRDAQGKHYCGGVLVSERSILTARHCLRDEGPPSSVQLHIVNSTDDTVAISYSSDSFDTTWFLGDDKSNDIGIIKFNLETVIQSEPLIRPICLPWAPVHQNIFHDSTSYHRPLIIGLGFIYVKPKVKGMAGEVRLADRLQKAYLPAMKSQVCIENYDTSIVALKENEKDDITNQLLLCTGKIKHGARMYNKDSCPGDSGGPLMKRSKSTSKRHFLQGLVQGGNSQTCGDASINSIGLYLNVEKKLDWIEQNL